MSKLDQVVRAFGQGRARTVGGLLEVDPETLDELVDEAEDTIAKRMKRAEWTQADLDRLACSFVVLAYAAELDRRTPRRSQEARDNGRER